MVTHLELSKLTAEWIVKKYMARWAVAEPNIQALEMPDVFGFKYINETIICEVKVSRADFLADSKKLIRKYEDNNIDLGMGKLRYYVTLGSFITIDELRPNWGLIEYRNNKFYTIKKSDKFSNFKDKETVLISEIVAKYPYIADRVYSNYNRNAMYDQK